MIVALTPTFASAAVCVVLALSPPAQGQPLPLGINPATFGELIWRETNADRAAHGQPALELASRITHAAQKYAEYQARTNATGHHADGQDPAQRIVAEGFRPCYWSENVYEQWNRPLLASWLDAAEGAMRSWRNSPGHALNMRDARAKYLGVGVAAWRHGDRNYYKVVQLFADDCPLRRVNEADAALEALRQ